MIGFEDYRLSISPPTAADRRTYYAAIEAALRAQEEIARAMGSADEHYASVRTAYARLVRAQLAFAEAQIADLTRRRAASADQVPADGVRP